MYINQIVRAVIKIYNVPKTFKTVSNRNSYINAIKLYNSLPYNQITKHLYKFNQNQITELDKS